MCYAAEKLAMKVEDVNRMKAKNMYIQSLM